MNRLLFVIALSSILFLTACGNKSEVGEENASLVNDSKTSQEEIASNLPQTTEIVEEVKDETIQSKLANHGTWRVTKAFSRVRLLATPWTAAYQAPPSMGFSRQEYWSGVPLPSPYACITQPKMLHFKDII